VSLLIRPRCMRSTPRAIFERGRAGLRYLLTSLTLVGLVFGAVGLGVVERMVLARLAALGTEVGRIAATGDLSDRLALSGSDELARQVTFLGQPAIQNIVRDITERKRAAEELRRAKEAAESADRAKRPLSSPT